MVVADKCGDDIELDEALGESVWLRIGGTVEGVAVA